jgi:ABC-type transport system substrate-binding protein/class 3 adenylate cyclase/tRNA A-37 threonylcarbamoyl transferase component Bud32/streptogramin lyase
MAELGIDIAEGTVLAGYRVERVLGRGATGTVYLARDDALDRHVALKLLAPDLARDPRFRERFLRESRIAAGLEHPGIVPIYAAGETEGTLFLAMRHVRGDLRAAIERAGRLEPGETLEILSQVGAALDAAHGAGLIHRDVKPGNVLVDGERAWLADFGLAKHAATVNSLSRDSGFAGTVSYIAPEQIQGAEVDGRADVYALGCVLFECLTGRAPFPRDNDLAIVFAHLREPPPSVSALRPELPEALDRVIAKALAKSPDERYRTCSDLVAEARSAVGGGEVAAAPARSTTLRTFLICDVRGYTRFTQQHGDEAAAELAATFAELVRVAVGEHEGRLIELRGDEALVVFESARGALRAALAIQQQVQDAELARGVGIGLDAGEAVPVGAGYRGGALNMAARLCSLAEPGQVIASEAVTHLARNVEGVRYLHGRIERLKGIEKPVRVVEVVTVQRGDAFRGRLRRYTHGRRWLAPGAAVVVLAAVAAGVIFGRGSSSTVALAAQIQPGSVGIFDAATHSLEKPIPVGGDVGDIAFGEGAIWAVVKGGTLVKIDPKTFAVERRIAIGGEGRAIAVGSGAVWVALDGQPAIVKVDPAFSTTERIPLPEDVTPGWDPADVSSVAAADGHVWVTQAQRRVVRLDAETGNVDQKVALPWAHWVVRTESGLYVLASQNGRVVKLDPESGDRIWTATLHPWLYDLASAGGIDWVVNNSDGAVFKLDDATGQVVGSVPVRPGLQNVETVGGGIWTDNAKGGTVTRIDVATGRKATFPVGHAPTGLAVFGSHVAVGLIPSPRDEIADVSGRVATFSMREDWLDGQTDPVNTWGGLGQVIEYATQAKLYNYPDKAGEAGGAPVPEVAAGMPAVSPDGRTVRLGIRPGYRFSPPSGAPVTAETVRYTLERAYSPKLGDPAAFLFLPELAGADAYVNHGADHISGVDVSGDTVTLHLTRPVPDIAEILAMPFFSLVPVGTPMTLLDDPIPSAGPYYISLHDWYVILRRNPNYHGPRPQRLDAIVWNIDVDTATAASRVIKGSFDGVYDPEGQVLSPASQIAHDYETPRADGPKYIRIPGRGVQFFALNTDAGPLRDPTLRRAIGYAIDRPALAAVTGAFPDDRYLPVGMPARSTQHVYPVDGPDVGRARALLRGRHPALTLDTCDRPDCVQRARILTANLKAVGITLHVRRFEDQYHAAPGFDLRDSTWFVDEFDPVNILGVPMFGQKLYFDVPTGFTDPTWKRRVRAADRLATTNGRFEAFGKLERGLIRGPVPWAAFADPAERMFLSADVGCVTMNPVYGLDYAALCVQDHPS